MATFEMEDSPFAGYMPEDTIQPAVVTTIRLDEKPYVDDDGNKVVKVVFKFTVDNPGDPHDGQTVYGETPKKFNNHPDCKLANWSREIIGSDLPVGYRLDTDMMIGNYCRIVIGLREYKKDGQDKKTNFVKDVMRSRDAMPAGNGLIDDDVF